VLVGVEDVVVVGALVDDDASDVGGGLAVLGAGAGLVMGGTMTTLGGGRVGTMTLGARFVVELIGSGVVGGDAAVIGLVDSPNVLACESCPGPGKYAYQMPKPATTNAAPAMIVTTCRSIAQVSV
jgi:hypothetical protein